MIVRTEPVDGEALFGSAARRDGDVLSDFDYLIVAADAAALRPRKRWLASQGFSVSDYTWKRLERCFNEGTLFALHLKLEARPTFDRTGRLRNLFQSFKQKPQYGKDYEESLELFRPLECIPASAIGRAWALDTLAVAFRNSAILSLADEGRHVFSMTSIVEEVATKGRINKEQAVSLHLLRNAKVHYRTGTPGYVSRHALDNALRAVQAALKLDFSSTEGGLPQVAGAYSKSVSAYARMRSIEAELISVPNHVMSNPEAVHIRSNLLHAVRDPHSYLWRFLHKFDAIEADLVRLRSFC
jgi:hypothetical protein